MQKSNPKSPYSQKWENLEKNPLPYNHTKENNTKKPSLETREKQIWTQKPRSARFLFLLTQSKEISSCRAIAIWSGPTDYEIYMIPLNPILIQSITTLESPSTITLWFQASEPPTRPQPSKRLLTKTPLPLDNTRYLTCYFYSFYFCLNYYYILTCL